MTPAQILAIVKDVVIVLAVGFLLWFVYHTGQNSVKTEDIKALQQRIEDNARTETQWRNDKTAADKQLASDVAAINSAAQLPKPPVWVCNSNNRGSVPAVAGKADSSNSRVGTIERGSGSGADATIEAVSTDEPYDARPAIEEVKKKYETVLAECRSVLDQWPVSTTR